MDAPQESTIEVVDLTKQENLSDLLPCLPDTPITPTKRKQPDADAQASPLPSPGSSPCPVTTCRSARQTQSTLPRSSHVVDSKVDEPSSSFLGLHSLAKHEIVDNSTDCKFYSDQVKEKPAAETVTLSKRGDSQPVSQTLRAVDVTCIDSDNDTLDTPSEDSYFEDDLTPSKRKLPKLEDDDDEDQERTHLDSVTARKKQKTSDLESSRVAGSRSSFWFSQMDGAAGESPPVSNPGLTNDESGIRTSEEDDQPKTEEEVEEDQMLSDDDPDEILALYPSYPLCSPSTTTASDTDVKDNDIYTSKDTSCATQEEVESSVIDQIDRYLELQRHLYESPEDELLRIHKDIVKSANSKYNLYIDKSSVEGAGWGLFAKKAIPAGAEIFVKPVMVHAIYKTCWRAVCDNCFYASPPHLYLKRSYRNPQERERRRLKVCQKCKAVAYCSKECSEQAWKYHHRYECIVARKSKGYARMPVERRLCVRIILRKLFTDFEKEWSQILALSFHPDHDMRKRKLDEVASKLKSLTERFARFEIDPMMYRDILYRVKNDATDITLSVGHNVGLALDPLLAMINHSCCPNTYPSCGDKGRLRLRSACPIAAGEEITRSYTNTEYYIGKREEELLGRYHFVCRCRRCEVERDMSCPNSLALNVNPIINQELIKLQPRIVVADGEELPELKVSVERVMAECNPPHPPHVHPVPNLMYSLSKASLRHGDYLEALKYALRCALYDREDTVSHLSSWELVAHVWNQRPDGWATLKNNKKCKVLDSNGDRKAGSSSSISKDEIARVNRALNVQLVVAEDTGSKAAKKKGSSTSDSKTKKSPPMWSLPPSSSSSSSGSSSESCSLSSSSERRRRPTIVTSPWIKILSGQTFGETEFKVLMRGYYLHWWKIAAKIYGPDSVYVTGWKLQFAEKFDQWQKLPPEGSETFRKLFLQAQRKLLDKFEIPSSMGISP